MDLKQYIMDKSKACGIDIIGFTGSDNMDYLRDYLIHRQEKNLMTEFESKDFDKRLNPSLTLPSCKSIIVIAISYNVSYDTRPDYKYMGRLSMSSWGTDYHRVLNGKMKSLVEKISEVVDFEYKYFVDTGPLVDRELAVKAGLGYYGKNCSVINPSFGSFIFLGYILTNLDLEPDSRLEEDCGDCDLCIRACPTKALEGSYRLNPKKCISYLTQTKGETPPDLIKKMGIKLYGCDICQLVCPKNKGVKYSSHEEFIPTDTKGYLDLLDLLTISNKDFKKKYGNMAGSWRGKGILKRNALNILENIFSYDLLKK